MATLTIAWHQVWLTQAPLSETCRKTLPLLPVTPGQLFDPAAQLALERSAQVNQAQQQFADLNPTPLPIPRHAAVSRTATCTQAILSAVLHCRMPQTADVLQVVSERDWFTSIGLKD